MIRRFFIPPDQISFPVSSLSGPEVHHIRKVLRIKPEDIIGFFDGTGYEYIGRILELSSNKASVEIIKKYVPDTESPIDITVGQAFLKENKMDRLIRQVTELGISRWLPFFCERSIPRLDSKRLLSRKERWQKIMIEAMKQSGKTRKLDILNPVFFPEILDLATPAELKIIFWEKASTFNAWKNFTEFGNHPKHIFFILGPEGGFSETEANQAINAGFRPAKLGPRILRAETATIAACALIQSFFGDLK
jgi:16S rRNA (uracil1498-N3)-methyltransferase